MARKVGKTAFALYFGNRGFFPASLISSAREEVSRLIEGMGHKVLMLDANATRHGAVETPREGDVYANFLKQHEDEVGGVILCLPNFGDETGAVAALKNANVPIFVQAYPDELTKMAPDQRRDSFCGKMSIMDVFYQNGIPFTIRKPHTVSPTSDAFRDNIEYFDRVCRTYGALNEMTVGAVGARTTPFKTVRIDELALQQHGITVETFDLSDVFAQLRDVSESSSAYKDKAELLKGYTDFSLVPDESFKAIVKLGVTLDSLVDEYRLDAIAIRCWLEMQKELHISPCTVMGEMNGRFVPVACEVDVGNAIVMYALTHASGEPVACLDWNNNYGDDEDKCILFHCGPVPQSMMTGKGLVNEHAILSGSCGPGCSWGCNTGRIKPMPFTFSSMMTEAGELLFYAGEGRFTEDPVPDNFFGCAGVAEIEDLQDVLMYAGLAGHRHHVSVTPGNIVEPFREALESYLGFDVTMV